MFTGLIREMATVKSFSGEKLVLKSNYKPKIGDSIAVNGACLTVVSVSWGGFAVELSHETQKLMATENLRGKVHMEPAMQLSDRLEGHIVQGHLDGTGEIVRIDRSAHGYDFFIKLSNELARLAPPKGSVTIDGVSLTINDIDGQVMRLTIIPHTLQSTLIGDYKSGRRVNVETDIFARYMDHLLRYRQKPDWDEIEKIQALY